MNVKTKIEEILLTEYQYIDCNTVDKLLDLFVVSGRSEQLPFSFIEWYSGMERQKILNAYERWKRENGNCH